MTTDGGRNKRRKRTTKRKATGESSFKDGVRWMYMHEAARVYRPRQVSCVRLKNTN